jgi:hypothetical protein
MPIMSEGVRPEGVIVWPWPDPEAERLAAEIAAGRAALAQRVVELAEQTGVDASDVLEPAKPMRPDTIGLLLKDWPEGVPRPEHPGNWRPNVRTKEREAIYNSLVENHTRPTNIGTLHEYLNWLETHTILDAGASETIRNVLLHSERGGRKNLRLITVEPAYDDESFVAKNRRFEQDYLGLEPLPVSDDPDDFGFIDRDLRITEDGLYARHDFYEDGKYFWERDGGDVPLEAVAKVLRMEPEALRQKIAVYAVHPEFPDGQPIAFWTMVRADRYIFDVMPCENDENSVTIGAVHELTDFGSYLFEEVLRAYEAGTQATQKN